MVPYELCCVIVTILYNSVSMHSYIEPYAPVNVSPQAGRPGWGAVSDRPSSSDGWELDEMKECQGGSQFDIFHTIA